MAEQNKATTGFLPALTLSCQALTCSVRQLHLEASLGNNVPAEESVAYL